MKIPICLGGLISPLHVLSTKSCFLTSDNKAIMKTNKRFKILFLSRVNEIDRFDILKDSVFIYLGRLKMLIKSKRWLEM